MAVTYYLEIKEVFDDSDERGWQSYDLVSEGNTLEELHANAWYIGTDQDGGEGSHREADDEEAEHMINRWFIKKHFGI